MANNISNILNNRVRLSGMASGLDTDSMVQQLMKIERMKVDRIKQDKQLLQWKRDDYRSIINSLRGLKDDYFDYLKPATNFRSATAFASYDTKSDNESIATVTASAGAASMTHTLKVTQLATAATVSSTSKVTSAVNGSNDITNFLLQGKQVDITLDGVKKTISLEDYSGIGDLQTKLQTAIDSAFGKTNAGTSKLSVLANGSKIELSPGLAGSTFELSETPNNFISSLGFASNQQNYVTGTEITTSDKSTLNGNFKISLGGVEKEISLSGLTASSTLDDVKTMVQGQLDTSFGSGKIAVSLNGNKLEFLTQTGEALVMSTGSTTNNLSALGFSSGASTTATSSANIDFSGNEKGKTFVLNINGTDKTITLSADHADINALQTDIQNQLGGTNISVGVSGNKLVFSSSDGSKIIYKQGPTNSIQSLGFASTDNVSNGLSLTSALDSIENHLAAPTNFDAAANVQFTINGTTINLNKTYAEVTLNDVMTAINTSAAGVEMKYDALKDKFTLTSRATGTSEGITITDTDPTNGLFKSLGIQQSNVQAGKDAIFSLDKVDNMQRSSNEFTINGVTYNLKSDASPATEVTITVNANADGLVEKIKGFVARYNEVLDKINGELSEKRERSYLPLTDEQKESMKEAEIKSWEEKANAGLLSNDSLLNNIATSMRNALTDGITGGSTTLAKIGITSGAYTMKGKLIIDETKLRAAIKDNIDGVVQLFTKDSSISYNDAIGDPIKKKTRYEESGLAERLFDIVQDNIRTTRDTNGKKGLLIEKAGINADSSDVKNFMNDLMDQKDLMIDKMLDKLANKENSLYKKFAALEKAMSQMNSQSSWISQQFGGGQ